MTFLSKGKRLTPLLAAVSATAITAFVAKPANAISFSLGGAPEFGSTTIDFEDTTDFPVNSVIPNSPGGTTVGDVTISTESGLVEVQENGAGTNTGIVIGRNTPGPGNPAGSVQFSFDREQRYFRFQWGGGRGGNRVQFFNNGDAVSPEFSAGDVGLPGGGGFVNFFADSAADVWDSVLLSDNPGGNFQFDNVSYSNVPTPALLPGLIGMGVAAMRKRKSEQDSLT